MQITRVSVTKFVYHFQYSRAGNNSELICECCYTQTVEMSRLDVKWVECFKTAEELKVKISCYLPMHVDFIINLIL